jgi:hypothetical protein
MSRRANRLNGLLASKPARSWDWSKSRMETRPGNGALRRSYRRAGGSRNELYIAVDDRGPGLNASLIDMRPAGGRSESAVILTAKSIAKKYEYAIATRSAHSIAPSELLVRHRSRAQGSRGRPRGSLPDPQCVLERHAHHCVCVAQDLPCGEPGCAPGDAISDDELKLRHVPPYAHGSLKHGL